MIINLKVLQKDKFTVKEISRLILILKSFLNFSLLDCFKFLINLKKCSTILLTSGIISDEDRVTSINFWYTFDWRLRRDLNLETSIEIKEDNTILITKERLIPVRVKGSHKVINGYYYINNKENEYN